MRILRLHIENFGKLHEFDMEFPEGLHMVCEDNGWGKSTLAAFIKAMFYGLPHTAKRSLAENDRKHYRPWQGGPFGGYLEFQAEDKAYRVERFFGTKDREDTFELYDLGTGLVSLDYSRNLGEELFHVDRGAYERSSFFAQQDLSVVMSDSLNARLTHMEADAGDTRNYEQAVASLENQMKYYQKTGNRGQIGKLEEARRAVREELSKCRTRESAMEEWSSRLSAQRQSMEDAAAMVKDAEKKLGKAQEYKKAQTSKAQYDLLKSQVEEKQKELQQTQALLEEYTDAVLGEEELDRCREQIYQLDVLKQREEEAKRQAGEAVIRQGNAEDARSDLTFPGVLFGTVAGLLPALGIFCLVCKMTAAGMALIGAGIAVLLLGFWRIRRYHEKEEQLEKQVQESGRQVRETDRTLREIQKKQETLEKKICSSLSLPPHTRIPEMEACWKQERKKSRRYRELKQNLESQKLEAARSRELWRRYEKGLSEEERKLLSGQQGSVPDIQVWKRRLQDCQKHLEDRKKEQREIRYRIAGLQEQAERIPELQEKEAWLSEQIAGAVREHTLLEQTVRYLKLAREQFSGRYLGELQNRLEDYLTSLGEEAPAPALDVSLQMKVQGAGAYRSLEYQSTGQQDLLRFAERLAVVDVLYKEEQPLMIMDDPFVHLDTAKQQCAMRLLKKMAEKRQILYFTCHEKRQVHI